MTYVLNFGGEVIVPVSVDHGQFIACDPEAELDVETYDEKASRDGLATWGNGGGITVFTASHWTDTHVAVALHRERPTLQLDGWDHIVEAGLALRRGKLHLYGPEDTGLNEQSMVVPPGTYSVVACGKDFDTTNEFGDEGNDAYALHLWPGLIPQRRVLKDGFGWMD